LLSALQAEQRRQELPARAAEAVSNQAVKVVRTEEKAREFLKEAKDEVAGLFRGGRYL